jgi:hypothetical protein
LWGYAGPNLKVMNSETETREMQISQAQIIFKKVGERKERKRQYHE